MLFKNDAYATAQLIRQGTVSVTEVTKEALGNIRQWNPFLNAVSHIQEKEALSLAKRADNLLAHLEDRSQLPAFYGVPLLLKDLGQEEAGQPSRSGAKLMKDYLAKRDSNFTTQVKKAGFVIVGRSNVPEFGFKNSSDSKWTGPVANPLNPELTPGGSSGGAVAALKAGLVPAVTASDGGGSIRIPASFSGLIGLKPTRGRTPVGPSSYRGWQGASIDFALHRSVRDAWLMLKALQVSQREAAFFCPKIEEDDLLPLDRPLKIAYSYQVPAGYPLTKEAKDGLNFALTALSDLGHDTIEVNLAIDGRRAMESYYMVNAVETEVMLDDIAQNLGRAIKPDDLEVTSWALYRAGKVVTGANYSRILAYWDQLGAQLETFFHDYDVFLSPSTNGPAFKQGLFSPDKAMIDRLLSIDNLQKSQQLALIWEVFEKSLAWTPFTQQQNLAGQPAISLPMYTTSAGLPLGIQAWSGRGKDYLLLQLAQQLEAANLLDTEVVDLSLH